MIALPVGQQRLRRAIENMLRSLNAGEDDSFILKGGTTLME